MPQDAVTQITLSTAELKTLIYDTVREALADMLDEDANSEPNFAPEIAERLRRYQQQKPTTIPFAEALKRLGMDA